MPLDNAVYELHQAQARQRDEAARRAFDGLSGLLNLADEAEARHWTKVQMIAQIRSIVGGVHEGLWADCLKLTRED